MEFVCSALAKTRRILEPFLVPLLGTWSTPWLLAFLTSGPKNGTKNDLKLEPKADTNLDSRILANRRRKPAKKITTCELLRQSRVHNCITQRRGT